MDDSFNYILLLVPALHGILIESWFFPPFPNIVNFNYTLHEDFSY